MKTWLTITMLVLLAGCESGALETGYVPRKLTDSPGERQSYYASPFSPEAANKNRDSASAGPDIGHRGPTRY